MALGMWRDLNLESPDVRGTLMEGVGQVKVRCRFRLRQQQGIYGVFPAWERAIRRC